MVFIVSITFSFSERNKLDLHGNICKSNGYCNIVKPEEDMSMLRYHHEQKQIEIPFFLYEDAESLLEEIEP